MVRILLSIISFKYSVFWIPLVILLAAVLAYFFYWRIKDTQELSRTKRILLRSIRMVLFLMLGILLLKPYTQFNKRIRKEPIVVFAQDLSSSIPNGADSVYFKKQFIEDRDLLTDALAKKYRVEEVGFGEELSDDLNTGFVHQQTNVEEVFSLFENRFFNQNIGALIIASDGKFNRGQRIENLYPKVSFPIYTIGLGDTLPGNDLFIQAVESNEKVYLSHRFPVFVNVQGRGCKGKQVELAVYRENKKIAQRILDITENQFFSKELFYFEEDKPGIKKYVIKIGAVDGEWNLENNTRTSYINVVDEKHKVLVLHNGVHPDIAAIKSVFYQNPVYAIDAESANASNLDIAAYDLVVLYQLPSLSDGIQNELKALQKNKIPALVVLGEQSNVKAIEQAFPNFSLKQQKNLFDDARAFSNQSFSLFNFESNENLHKQNPPLKVPYGNYSDIASGNILFYQSIGQVETRKPLVWFSEYDGIKNGYIAGEGIWRWRLKEYQLTKEAKEFEEWISKSFQYLLAGSKREQFSINTKVLPDNEVMINAVFYNDGGELDNRADPEFTLNNEQGVSFPYRFTKTEQKYEMRINSLEPGYYTYNASLKAGEKEHTVRGGFVIEQAQLEFDGQAADFNLLRLVAQNTGGAFFNKSNVQALATRLLNEEKLAVSFHIEKRNQNLLDNIWLLIIIVLLCASEWFLRKYWGQV